MAIIELTSDSVEALKRKFVKAYLGIWNPENSLKFSPFPARCLHQLR